MLEQTIENNILLALNDAVLSTSDVARRVRIARSTAAKYLQVLQSRFAVQRICIGTTVAWRASIRKPLVALMLRTRTARMVKLALGEKYSYYSSTNPASLRDSFVLITDDLRCARSALVPVICVGSENEDTYVLPTLFDTRVLRVLVKKIYLEQDSPDTTAQAGITVEHLEQFEAILGVHRADELLDLTQKLLLDHKIVATQCERNTFLIAGSVDESALTDIEETFRDILSHLYGREVVPGEKLEFGGEEHTVPELTITVTETPLGEIADVSLS